jgi:hypothetical protein
MSNLNIHTFVWSGMPGAPGYSNFYTTAQPGEVVETTRMAFWTFFNKWKGLLPASVTITPNSTYRVVDEATGDFVDERNYADSPSAIPGGGTVNFAGPSGACVTWRTTTPGKRGFIRGRTFMVPLSTNVMQNDGTIIDSALASMRQFAAELVSNFALAGPQFVVYRRPHAGVGGLAAKIVSSSISDEIAILRSRRN